MPIQGPIDYSVDVKNPFLQGLQAYQQGQVQQQAIEAQNQQQLANFERKKAMAEFAAKENKTAEDYMGFLEANPDLAASYKEVYSMRSDQWKQADIQNAQRVHAALSTGNIDAAKADLDRQIEANINSGDTVQAESLKMIRDQIDLNPKGAEVASGSYLAAVQDPNEFSENMARIEENRQQIQMQPGAIEKQKLENIQAGVDVGLSRIDAEKKFKEIDKLDAETKKLVMEVEGMQKGGVLSPDKKVELEQKLADKYYSRNQNYIDRVGAYNNLVESAKQDTGPGDFALIVAFNKMLDPRSVVRESEFALAEASAGRMQQMLNFFKKFKEGDRLKPGQRQQFVDLAKKYMDESEKNQKIVTDQIVKTADAYNLNKELIIPERRKIEETVLGEKAAAPKIFNTMAEAETASIDLPKGTRVQVGNEIFEVE